MLGALVRKLLSELIGKRYPSLDGGISVSHVGRHTVGKEIAAEDTDLLLPMVGMDYYDYYVFCIRVCLVKE